MAAVYKFYKRCHGCRALVAGKDTFTCGLGFSVNHEVLHGISLAPRPETKCYKPRNDEDMEDAETKLARK